MTRPTRADPRPDLPLEPLVMNAELQAWCRRRLAMFWAFEAALNNRDACRVPSLRAEYHARAERLAAALLGRA